VAWQRELNSVYRPQTMVIAAPSGMRGLPPTLDKAATNAVSAWVCHGFQCLPPFTHLSALTEALAPTAA
jgi:uncharacterized protein YyaL (SSP411 family)